MQTGVLEPDGLSGSQLTLGSVRYEEGAYVRIQQVKPSDEFAGRVTVKGGLRDHEMDRSLVLMTDTPCLTSASGFEDRVAEAAQDQGLRHQSGWIIFDEKNRLDGQSICTKKEPAPVTTGLGGR